MTISSGVGEIVGSEKKLRLQQLTDEEWALRNDQLSETLQEHFSPDAASTKGKDINISRLYRRLEGGINTVFSDLLMTNRPQKREDAMRTFLAKYASRPQITYLKEATKKGGAEAIAKLTNDISRDGWREFLEKRPEATLVPCSDT